MCLELLRPFGRKTGAMQIAALALACAIAMTSATRAQAPSPQSGEPNESPMPVVTASAALRTVPVYLKSAGTAVASRITVVRSAVGGKLTEIDFTAGQRVVAGDLLARVAPRADQARRDRDATEIRAPASGIVGGALRHLGDRVSPADETGIVTISRTDPISVVFALPETVLRAVREKLLQGNGPVRAYGHDKVHALAEGQLRRGDLEPQQGAGTGDLVARFANTDHALSPGMHVDVLVPTNATRTALAIPLAAVRQSSTGYYTYMVTRHETAHVRPLGLGPVTGDFVVVREGLWPGDVIVTDGQEQLTEGSRIAIVEGPSPGTSE